jgi:hypothetical protein
VSIHDHTRDTYCIHLFTCTIAHCTWLMGTGYWVLYTREHNIDVYNAVRQCGLWSRDPWELGPRRRRRGNTHTPPLDALECRGRGARGPHARPHAHPHRDRHRGRRYGPGPNEETQALVAGAIPHSEAVQAPGKERGFIQLSCTSEGSQVLVTRQRTMIIAGAGQDTRSTEKDHRTSIKRYCCTGQYKITSYLI